VASRNVQPRSCRSGECNNPQGKPGAFCCSKIPFLAFRTQNRKSRRFFTPPSGWKDAAGPAVPNNLSRFQEAPIAPPVGSALRGAGGIRRRGRPPPPFGDLAAAADRRRGPFLREFPQDIEKCPRPRRPGRTTIAWALRPILRGCENQPAGLALSPGSLPTPSPETPRRPLRRSLERIFNKILVRFFAPC
jgi:hypothetical protein